MTGVKQTVSIIIVNYNSGESLQECVNSLESVHENMNQSTGDTSLSTYIVDNNSSDNSLEKALGGTDSERFHAIRNSTNRGFAAACNQATSKTDSDYYLFLNPDTIPNIQSIEHSIEYISKMDSVGVVGVQLTSGGDVQRTCARKITPTRMVMQSTGMSKIFPVLGYRMDEWPHKETQKVDHVIGAYYLIEADLFHRIGGFDERFFVFYEDIDLSERVRNHNYEIHFLATESIVHNNEEESVSKDRLELSIRSRLKYCRKHFSERASTAVIAILLIVEPILRISRSLINRDITQIRSIVAAYYSIIKYECKNTLW